MKRVFVAAVWLLWAGASCGDAGSASQQTIVVRQSDVCRAQIGVDGMSCVGCEVTLEESLSKLEGVVSVRASHKKKEVVIEYDSTRTDLGALRTQIRAAGYKTIPGVQ